MKRLFAVLLVTALLLSLAPISALAEEGSPAPAVEDVPVIEAAPAATSVAETIATVPTEAIAPVVNLQAASCGENLTWKYDTNNTGLTISGTGPMKNFTYDDFQPWASSADQTYHLTIAEGVTTIGDLAFYGFRNLRDIVIPDSVTYVGDESFEGCTSASSAYIGSSVKTIGLAAFMDCINLTSITLPISVTSLGQQAFYGCSRLESITIGNGVTSIGDHAFYACNSLVNVYYLGTEAQWNAIEIGNGNTCLTSRNIHFLLPAEGSCGDNSTWTIDEAGNLTISGTGAMDNYSWSPYDAPWEVYQGIIKTVTINSGVTSIGSSAFYNCSALTSITIPDSVTSIGGDAFYGCTGLTSVVIPDSVSKIENYTFYRCNELKHVFFGGTTEQWSAITVGSNNEPLQAAAIHALVTEQGDSTVTHFGTCGENLIWTLDTEGTLTISGTGKMADYGEAYNSSSASSWVTSAPWGEYYRSINSVFIDTGVTSIGDFAFFYCCDLAIATIPNSITVIGRDAFYGCTGLTSVVYCGTEAQWNGISIGVSNAPLKNAARTYQPPLTLPQSGTCGDNLWWTLDVTGTLTIVGTGSTIPDYSSETPWYNSVHANNVSDLITKIDIRAQIVRIGNYAFRGCSNVKSIAIPGSVLIIGNAATTDCNRLTSITFDGTQEQRSAIVIDSGNDPLINATWLLVRAKGTCGSNLTWILDTAGNLSISGTGNMDSYEARYHQNIGTVSNAPWWAYYSNDMCVVTTVEIGNGATSVGNYAFTACWDLRSATIPDGITRIGSYAFKDCRQLETISIPSSVKVIDEEAFSNCRALNNIDISSGVERIINGAFDACGSLTDVYYNGSEAQWNAITIGSNNEPLQNATIHFAAQHEHSYTEQITLDPGCTTTGTKTYTCSGCGDSYTETIPALGHNWDDGVVTTPATATTEGVMTYTCTRCSETKTEAIPMLTRKPTITIESVDVPAGTGTQEVEITVTLSDNTGLAGANPFVTYADGLTLKKVQAGEALNTLTFTPGGILAANPYGLLWDGMDADASNGVIVTLTFEVSVENEATYPVTLTYKPGDVYDGNMDDVTVNIVSGGITVVCTHSWVCTETTVAATCTAAGAGTYTCGICGRTKSDTIPALGHDLVHHEGQAATCTEGGWKEYDTCTRCDYTTYESIAAAGHDYVPAVTTPATCSATGVRTYTCSHDASHTYTETIQALGHNLVHHDGQAPTCTASGWRDYDACTRCDYTTYSTIPALGHAWNEGAVTTPSTCTEAGVKTYTCTNDVTHTYTETIPALGHNPVHHEAQAPTCTEVGWVAYDTCTRCDYTTYVEIPASGHTLTAAVRENEIAATCEAAGSYDEVVYCAVCKAEVSRKQQTVAALGHVWDEGTVTVAPGCTTEGLMTFTCKHDASHTYTDTIPAAGHDYVKRNGVDATCTEKGWAVFGCTNCSDTVYREYDPIGHDYDDGVVTVAATCTSVGTKTYTCKNDATHTYTETIPALGHTIVDHEAKAATCTEIGWNAYETCSRCDYTTYVEIPALGHKPAEAVRENEIAATCESAGSYDDVVYCSVCKAELSRNSQIVDAFGHEWDEGVVSTAATCTADGVKLFTCKHDANHTYTETILALGHDFKQMQGVAATCTEGGFAVFLCSRCNLTNYEEYEALGHDLVHHDAKAATCEEIGWAAYDACTRCDYTTRGEDIPALGHDLVHHEAQAPTHTEVGWEAYDTCSRCDYTTYVELPVLPYIPGDINGDDAVNAKDVTLLRRFIAGGYGITVIDSAIDVNKDGAVNAKDVTILRRFIAGGYGITLG